MQRLIWTTLPVLILLVCTQLLVRAVRYLFINILLHTLIMHDVNDVNDVINVNMQPIRHQLVWQNICVKNKVKTTAWRHLLSGIKFKAFFLALKEHEISFFKIEHKFWSCNSCSNPLQQVSSHDQPQMCIIRMSYLKWQPYGIRRKWNIFWKPLVLYKSKAYHKCAPLYTRA